MARSRGVGVDDHFDGSATPGLLEEIAGNVLLASSEDIDGTRALLESRDDIAAVVLEPTGGSFGVLPLTADFVHMLRRVTAAQGIILIFDEVVTGFRVSRGGAQAHYGITPDLATFAKILAGGLPGGAVTGPEAILERLDFDAAKSKGFEKIGHQGTYNANPVCARDWHCMPGAGRLRRCLRARESERSAASCGIERRPGRGTRVLGGLRGALRLLLLSQPR